MVNSFNNHLPRRVAVHYWKLKTNSLIVNINTGIKFDYK